MTTKEHKEVDGRLEGERQREFMAAILDDVRALEYMLDHNLFETGVRRIGAVVNEQVGLYGTLTGARPAPKRVTPPADASARMADVLPLPARRPAEGDSAHGS